MGSTLIPLSSFLSLLPSYGKRLNDIQWCLYYSGFGVVPSDLLHLPAEYSSFGKILPRTLPSLGLPWKEVCTTRMTKCAGLPRTVASSALTILHPRTPLGLGLTGMVGHPHLGFCPVGWENHPAKGRPGRLPFIIVICLLKVLSDLQVLSLEPLGCCGCGRDR